MGLIEHGREPEDPTGYRKQAVRLANERDDWKALAKSWGDEKDRLTAEHRGAVASLAVIRGALDDLEHAPHRAQALADLPDIIRAALGGQ